jgi:hypothetical protein
LWVRRLMKSWMMTFELVLAKQANFGCMINDHKSLAVGYKYTIATIYALLVCSEAFLMILMRGAYPM